MPITIIQEANRFWSGASLARFNQQADALLTQIEANPGISGAFLCSNHGAVLAARLARTRERETLEAEGRWLAAILAAAEIRSGRVKEIELRCTQAGFLVRDLGNAFGVIMCAPGANWALLRMALNITAPPFQRDVELQKNLSKTAPARADALKDEPDLDAQRWIRRIKMASSSV